MLNLKLKLRAASAAARVRLLARARRNRSTMTAGTRKYREFLILRRFLITVVLGLVSHGGETLLAQQENSITAAPAASKVITEKFEHWRND